MKFVDTLKARASKLKTQLTALWYASRDKRIPLLPKLIIAVTVAYAVSPIDLIPDFIPVIGYLDDLLVLPALIALAIRLIPAEVMDDAQKKAAEEPVQLKKNWLIAAVFIMFWILIIGLVIAALA